MGRSTKYYQTHPKARKKKAAYDKRKNAEPEQVRKRVESNKKRREAKRAGKNIKGKDYDHATKRFVKSSVNRGRKGEGTLKSTRPQRQSTNGFIGNTTTDSVIVVSSLVSASSS